MLLQKFLSRRYQGIMKSADLNCQKSTKLLKGQFLQNNLEKN